MRTTFNAGRSGTRGAAGASGANAHQNRNAEQMRNEEGRMRESAGTVVEGYSRAPMKSAAVLAFLTWGLCLGMAACGGTSDPSAGPTAAAGGPTAGAAARTPLPAPNVVLTADEQQVWAKLPPDRSAIPVLLYHGIGPESDFSNASDASYGIGTEDFAKQMTMIQHAGYETIGLQTFIDFVENKRVDLPPRPLLLTFDDARANSWTGADGILRKLRFNAVMFVDVGRVAASDPEYLTSHELATMQDSGRWQLQLHSGKGHTQIHYGPGPDDYR